MPGSLSLRSRDVEPYPAGIRPVAEPVPGTAFFPGGRGLWLESGAVPDPTGGVFFLGNDLDSEGEFADTLARGHEDLNGPTWRNLLTLLDHGDIRPEQCFFTNYFMGARTADERTGPYPGAEDPGFVERCGRFLMQQLAEMRPRAIFTLGSYVPGLLGALSPQLASWKGIRGLTRLDAQSTPLMHQVHFAEAGLTTNVAALTHPSLHKVDVHRRIYRGMKGHSAELLLVLDALASA